MIDYSIDNQGVVTLTLNRPEKHNALTPAMIAELHDALERISANAAARVVVLTGAGTSFCAGADIAHMRSMMHASRDDNVADANALARCLRLLDELDRPVIARVNGNVFGGGVGLVACADIVIAARSVKFALTEVKLGLVPAVISPFVVGALGARHARRLILTAAPFDAARAETYGLVHEAVADVELDATVARQVDLLLRAGPHALKAAKSLLRTLQRSVDRDAVQAETVRLLAELRASSEGQEGLSAFLERREPAWVRNP